MPKPKHAQYDVVIIGAGMVGLSLASALQKKLQNTPAKTLLLESRPISGNKIQQPGFDARSTVLSYGTVSQLQRLNLWESLKPKACPIKKIHVSDQGRFGQTLINAEEEKVPVLGYVLENQDIGQVLNVHVLASEFIETVSPVEVNMISHESNHARLQCESEGESFAIETSLVVLAEGGRSGLCEKLGIKRKQHDYQQIGIIANLAFEHSHDAVAYERFTAKGPLAVLPLNDFEGEHRGALIWSQRADNFQQVFELSDEDLLQVLQKEFGHRLGQITKIGERLSFPFILEQAEEQIRHNLVLLGNTAHTLHPVAGQGFNLAFREAMVLAENINTSFKQGLEPGTYSQLQRYMQAVNEDQGKTIGFSHHLTSLFSSDKSALALTRKLALISIDLLPSFKKALSSQAMGMS